MYIVIVGNFMRAYGPFETQSEAKEWANTADFTSITDNGRISTTVMPLTKGNPFAFKVEVEGEYPADALGNDQRDDISESIVTMATTFEGAEAKAKLTFLDKYPGATVTYVDARVRQ